MPRTGTWRCQNGSVAITWSHGFTDKLTLSPNCRSLTGFGNTDPRATSGHRVSGDKLGMAPSGPGCGNLAGTWISSLANRGQGSWVFTPLGDGRYAARESGFSNASGAAALRGSQLTIDFTFNGARRGAYSLTMNADCSRAEGSWQTDVPDRGTATFVRSRIPEDRKPWEGPPLVVVPNVVGIRLDAAVAQLRAVGLRVADTIAQVLTRSPGVLVSGQSVPAGSAVNPGTVVLVQIPSDPIVPLRNPAPPAPPPTPPRPCVGLECEFGVLNPGGISPPPPPPPSPCQGLGAIQCPVVLGQRPQQENMCVQRLYDTTMPTPGFGGTCVYNGFRIDFRRDWDGADHFMNRCGEPFRPHLSLSTGWWEGVVASMERKAYAVILFANRGSGSPEIMNQIHRPAAYLLWQIEKYTKESCR